MEESKKKPIMIIVIVVCLGAAAAIFWGTGRGGGGTIDSISDEEMIWAKCNNPACKAEYQTSKKGYFKYVTEHVNPMAPSAPPMVCEKCGEHSVFWAEKCMNPDCGIVFLRGTVPNDFPDRCPQCKRSETEEIRKRRRAGGTR